MLPEFHHLTNSGVYESPKPSKQVLAEAMSSPKQFSFLLDNIRLFNLQKEIKKNNNARDLENLKKRVNHNLL